MNRVRPHGAWFLLVPAFLAAGVAATVLLVAGAAGNIQDNLHKVAVPGGETVTFSQAGPQTIFYEESTSGRDVTVPLSLEVQVTPVAGGDPLPIRPALMRSTYQYGTTCGVGIGTVEVPAAGMYRVETRLGHDTKAAPGAALAVGGNPVGGVLGAVFGSLGAMGLGFMAALATMIVLLIKRSNSRKRLIQQQYAQMPMGAPMPQR